MVILAFGSELDRFSPVAGCCLENDVAVLIAGGLIEIVEKESSGKERNDKQ